jgi:TIR domain
LRALGLEVWYDEFEIRIGQSLSEAIDYGIKNSAFGVVVLSPVFLKKKPWARHELQGLMSGKVSGKQVMLPLWHRVDFDDIYAFSPTLTDTVAYVTDKMTLDSMAAGIEKVVRRATK